MGAIGLRQLGERWYIEDVAHGAGVSANVYKGYDSQNGMRTVAVKLFHGRRSDNPILQKQFQNELSLFNDFDHPNIIGFLQWGVDSEQHPYLVLEWMDDDLKSFLSRTTPGGWDDFADTALSILRGLAYIHEKGHVHRDIKPSNIMVNHSGVPKLTDFGISRLRGAVTYDNVTFVGGGTEPYLPPKDEDPELPLTYRFDRDVYAFAVIVVEVLSGANLRSTDDVANALQNVDAPPHVLDFLSSALSLDATKRPTTAGAALLLLEGPQAKREQHWREQIVVPIEVKSRAAEVVVLTTGMSVQDATAFIVDDMNEDATVTVAAGDNTGKTVYRPDDLQVVTAAYSYRLRQDVDDPSKWVVIGAWKTGAANLDTARESGFRDNLVFRVYSQCPSRTPENADRLFDRVAEHVQARRAEERFDVVKRLFGAWSGILHAKRKVEDMRGEPVRFRDIRVKGRRLWLDVGKTAPEDLVGQPRVIRLGERRSVHGEIEQVSEGWVVLYVESGGLADLQTSGELHYDTDASKAALKRQENALNAVRHARSVRPDLRELIARPDTVRAPIPVQHVDFKHEELDDSKKNAVYAALNLEDLVVVEGPPGTGKTTFIAELITQFLEMNRGSRVLLTSQTHAALDHALDGIHRLTPSLRVVRLGRPDRISEDVDHLRLEQQVEDWRQEVLSKSRSFMTAKAQEWGVSVSQAEMSAMASSLREVGKRMNEIRSRLKREHDERRVAVEEMERLNALAPEVLEVLERVETALRISSSNSLTEVAKVLLDRGLDLAKELEAGSDASRQIAEYDELLQELGDQLREVVDADRALRAQLAKALSLDADAPPDSDALLQRSAEYSVDDERLARLEALYTDWDRRFGRSSEFGAALIASCDVIAATCVGVGFGVTSELEYDLCIIDETSKATATEALIPMSRSRKWVLVGDRRQLPPFQERALSDPEIRKKFELSSETLGATLLDRLADSIPKQAYFMLELQHRMVPAIGDLVSECFYSGRLQSADKESPKFLEQAFRKPVLWVSTSGRDGRADQPRPGSTSYSNELEANEIRTLMAKLAFHAQGAQLSVAVLTGYADQRDLIKKVLFAASGDLIGISYEVSTVDAFQGREADVCIFSLTRSNAKGDLGFLTSRQRINVALSRGRYTLVLVGDASFVETASSNSNPLQDVLSYIRRNGDTCELREGRS